MRRIVRIALVVFVTIVLVGFAVWLLVSRESRGVDRITSFVKRGLNIGPTPSPSFTPSSDMWPVVESDEWNEDGNRIVQVRGLVVSVSEDSLVVRTGGGEYTALVPDQVEYRCLPVSMSDEKTGEDSPVSQAFLNLIGMEGVSRMTKRADIFRSLRIGDEIIIVGERMKGNKLNGQLVVTIKC